MWVNSSWMDLGFFVRMVFGLRVVLRMSASFVMLRWLKDLLCN